MAAAHAALQHRQGARVDFPGQTECTPASGPCFAVPVLEACRAFSVSARPVPDIVQITGAAGCGEASDIPVNAKVLSGTCGSAINDALSVSRSTRLSGWPSGKTDR